MSHRVFLAALVALFYNTACLRSCGLRPVFPPQAFRLQLCSASLEKQYHVAVSRLRLMSLPYWSSHPSGTAAQLSCQILRVTLDLEGESWGIDCRAAVSGYPGLRQSRTSPGLHRDCRRLWGRAICSHQPPANTRAELSR